MSLHLTPEDTQQSASEAPAGNGPVIPPADVAGTPPKAAQPARPTTNPIIAEVLEIIREKFNEAARQLHPAISAEMLATVVDVEAKRRSKAIMQDAAKYARNRAKSEKITPWFLGEAVFDHLGLERGSGRADKSAKKSPPSCDMKGGDHGSK